MDINYTSVRDFTPNLGAWTEAGRPLGAVQQTGSSFSLTLGGGLSINLSFLSSTCFRVRFSSAPNAVDGPQASPAVVQPNLGPVNLEVTENSAARLVVDTGAMRVEVDLQPYRVQVFRGTHPIPADTPTYNPLCIPFDSVIANFKTCGGSQLLRLRREGRHAVGEKSVHLDPVQLRQLQIYCSHSSGRNDTRSAQSERCPLHSIPFMLEVIPQPGGAFAGAGLRLWHRSSTTRRNPISTSGRTTIQYGRQERISARCSASSIIIFSSATGRPVPTQYTTLTGRAADCRPNTCWAIIRAPMVITAARSSNPVANPTAPLPSHAMASTSTWTSK